MGVTFQDPTAEMVKMNKMFYPRPWLDAIGYFETLEVRKGGTLGDVPSLLDAHPRQSSYGRVLCTAFSL